MTTTCGDAGGVTKSGAACRSVLNLSSTSGRCVQHDPARQSERLAMLQAGGRAAGLAKRQAREAEMTAAVSGPAGMPTRLETLDDATKLAAWITLACLRGQIDARTAESATKGVRQFQLSREKKELVDRIRILEKALAAAQKASL